MSYKKIGGKNGRRNDLNIGHFNIDVKDIQKEPDFRKLSINKVGVKNLSYPITILDKANKYQHTVANVNMYVDLPHHFKGTHMSRFVEILNTYRGMINIKNIWAILDDIKLKLEAETAHLEMSFPYFIEKKAPISKSKGLMGYNCSFIAACNCQSQNHDFMLQVEVPISTLCPCSKEISNFGAHNQRGVVTLQVRFRKMTWIEDLVELVEKCGSSPVYSVLKRSDEKFVTEKAYRNPVFVEDVVRNVAERVIKNPNIYWFRVQAENFESIHNHSAYAMIEKDLREESR